MHKLALLAENTMHSSLRTKRIQGTRELFECSANMDIRIVWFYQGDMMIILVDVGHHDVLDQYYTKLRLKDLKLDERFFVVARREAAGVPIGTSRPSNTATAEKIRPD